MCVCVYVSITSYVSVQVCLFVCMLVHVCNVGVTVCASASVKRQNITEDNQIKGKWNGKNKSKKNRSHRRKGRVNNRGDEARNSSSKIYMDGQVMAGDGCKPKDNHCSAEKNILGFFFFLL